MWKIAAVTAWCCHCCRCCCCCCMCLLPGYFQTVNIFISISFLFFFFLAAFILHLSVLDATHFYWAFYGHNLRLKQSSLSKRISVNWLPFWPKKKKNPIESRFVYTKKKFFFSLILLKKNIKFCNSNCRFFWRKWKTNDTMKHEWRNETRVTQLFLHTVLTVFS